MTMRLLLLRHCEAAGQGPDAPLTPAGAAAAERVASVLAAAGVDAIYSSPYRRAMQTVEPFAAQSGLAIEADARLREQTLADPPVADWLDHVRRSFDDPDHRAPGGESIREVRTRGLAALAEIAAAGHGLAAVATHGRWLAAVIETVDATFGFDDWLGLTNPDLYVAAFDAGNPVSAKRSPEAVNLFGGGDS